MITHGKVHDRILNIYHMSNFCRVKSNSKSIYLIYYFALELSDDNRLTYRANEGPFRYLTSNYNKPLAISFSVALAPSSLIVLLGNNGALQ